MTRTESNSKHNALTFMVIHVTVTYYYMIEIGRLLRNLIQPSEAGWVTSERSKSSVGTSGLSEAMPGLTDNCLSGSYDYLSNT